MEKICSICKLKKEYKNFGSDKRRKNGLRSECNECRKILSKKYLENNKEKRKETIKKYYENNKLKESERLKKYRKENSEKRKETKLNWVKKNKEKYNEYSRNWKKNKFKNDVTYKLITNLRIRTKSFLRNTEKKFDNIIGCTPEDLKIHLEKKFTGIMTWENYGFYGWHIDHIIPLSSAKNEDELLKLCHFSNLQPLWCSENLKKGNKIL